MSRDQLLTEFRGNHEAVLKKLAVDLEALLRDHLGATARIDRVSARAKSPDRFVDKALKVDKDGAPKYPHPFAQIQDLVGVRIVVFYKQDVDVVSDLVGKYFRHIEKKDLIPENESEFGYVGKHFILAVPSDVIPDEAEEAKRLPKFFELQIKTLFQHAWSEANHDLAYKPDTDLTSHQKRLVAFTAAQAWGADTQFALLHTELNGAPPAS